MSADVTREPTGGQGLREWRVWGHYGTHVFVDDRPVATFHDPADAERAVTAVNNWRRATTGDPTEPEPLAMQARELLLRVRELEATVARVRGLHDRLIKQPNDRAYYFAGLLRRALDGDR